MTLGDELLTILTDYRGGYRLMRRTMRDRTAPRRTHSAPNASEQVLRVTFTRLKQRGLVQNKEGLWFITKQGKEYIAKRLPWLRSYTQERKTKKNMIIAFDIPERKRREREWLRHALQDLGFTILQRSVWFGPAPLPKEFVVSVEELEILDHMKFFNADEWEIV